MIYKSIKREERGEGSVRWQGKCDVQGKEFTRPIFLHLSILFTT